MMGWLFSNNMSLFPPPQPSGFGMSPNHLVPCFPFCVFRMAVRITLETPGTLEPPQSLTPPPVSYQRPLVALLDWVISISGTPYVFWHQTLQWVPWHSEEFKNYLIMGPGLLHVHSNSWGKGVEWGLIGMWPPGLWLVSWDSFPFLDGEGRAGFTLGRTGWMGYSGFSQHLHIDELCWWLIEWGKQKANQGHT